MKKLYIERKLQRIAEIMKAASHNKKIQLLKIYESRPWNVWVKQTKGKVKKMNLKVRRERKNESDSEARLG